MSNYDVVIGNGVRGFSARRINFYNISESNNCYWIYNVYAHYNMFIFKDTREGIFLKKMIDRQINSSIIELWIKRIFFKNLSPHKLITMIDEINQKSFEEGRESKRNELLYALGIKE